MANQKILIVSSQASASVQQFAIDIQNLLNALGFDTVVGAYTLSAFKAGNYTAAFAVLSGAGSPTGWITYDITLTKPVCVHFIDNTSNIVTGFDANLATYTAAASDVMTHLPSGKTWNFWSANVTATGNSWTNRTKIITNSNANQVCMYTRNDGSPALANGTTVSVFCDVATSNIQNRAGNMLACMLWLQNCYALGVLTNPGVVLPMCVDLDHPIQTHVMTATVNGAVVQGAASMQVNSVTAMSTDAPDGGSMVVNGATVTYTGITGAANPYTLTGCSNVPTCVGGETCTWVYDYTNNVNPNMTDIFNAITVNGPGRGTIQMGYNWGFPGTTHEIASNVSGGQAQTASIVALMQRHPAQYHEHVQNYGTGGTGPVAWNDQNGARTVSTTTGNGVNPIVVTTTAPHGYVTGQQIQITGVVGNTAANANASIVVQSPTTCAMYALNSAGQTGIAGNGAYVSGGSITFYGLNHPANYAAMDAWMAYEMRLPTPPRSMVEGNYLYMANDTWGDGSFLQWLMSNRTEVMMIREAGSVPLRAGNAGLGGRSNPQGRHWIVNYSIWSECKSFRGLRNEFSLSSGVGNQSLDAMGRSLETALFSILSGGVINFHGMNLGYERPHPIVNGIQSLGNLASATGQMQWSDIWTLYKIWKSPTGNALRVG